MKTKKIKISKKLLVLIILLSILLAVLLIFQFGIFEKIKKPSKDRMEIQIKDKCGLILGNLIHEIKGEGDCNIKCINECRLNNMEISSYQFIENETSCHLCNCYCE